MRRTILIATAFAVAMVPIEASGSIRAYNKCAKSYGGEQLETGGQILLGILTFDLFGWGRGHQRQHRTSKAIQKNCWPLLSPEEQRTIQKRRVEEIRREKHERPWQKGGDPR
ncbi:hypothetical protein HFN65_31570 [Rhizobium laguerreae]|uniref:hypothetical protein n=1 Tax=Rhizobium laguerreae TaxID=1076926 RepID=UPI001C905C73|nr:hypothetical protein [Rhizobium laguerreae]MBY3575480.1 hypothetical protein [Rhizobium laguerreae]